jgi:hypothetical protein
MLRNTLGVQIQLPTIFNACSTFGEAMGLPTADVMVRTTAGYAKRRCL